MNIYVGNIGPEVTEEQLAEAFKAFGQVESVQVIRDMFSGASKGFGFVEMPGRQHSLNAIAGLHGKDFQGRPLRVNEARPKGGGGRRR